MKIVPLTLKEAEEFLAKHDRHYKAPAEPICAVGVGEMQEVPIGQGGSSGFKLMLHGAAILGRNSAEEAELAHIYADGSSQAYSLLYGGAWRALKALGYRTTVL